MISHLETAGANLLRLRVMPVNTLTDSYRQTWTSGGAPRRHAPRNFWPPAFDWRASDMEQDRFRAHVLARGLHATEIGWTARMAVQVVENTEDLKSHTLVYCPEGGAVLEFTERRVKLTAGQAVLLPARTVFRLTSRSQHPVTVSWLRFAGDDSDYYVWTLGKGLALISVSAAARERIRDAFEQLAGLVTAAPSEWSLIQCSHLVRLLLGHLLGERRFALQPHPEPHHPGVAAAVEFMRTHLNQPLSLGDIARRAGLSVSHFCALFRSQMDMTPMDYLIQLKIQKARHLLVSTALTVQEVAQQVGYDDRYYFSRLFRKLNGVPPVSYRQQQRMGA